ncbi:uncharacterized protein LOC125229135 [Leguminivora glycinivorella]|uniref:uncharacterized protein LOC125229135 n=1 Tax=Leguminivora glycinivorella TaxID=1035111 RepID=UPI00200C8EC3|nr:uncharacterized protein LOC125229135 [Leguminivora glycinivorella]XP_047989879.1 uncharacterized protein LOC125229135 [Leguminivora glycinivorella]
MTKRKRQEKIEHYQRKLRKYAGLRFSSSSSDENSEDEEFLDQEVLVIPDDDGQGADAPSNDEAPEAAPGDGSPAPVALDVAPVPETAEVPDLDPELVTALGEATDDKPKFGDKIHEKLASLWPPLLRKGLPSEAKEKLKNEYLIPENCTLLQAPKLNPEISAAITEMVRNRDKKLEASQQQLGLGITAVNRSLSILLASDDKVTAIKLLSDSCRILSDLHFGETQTRIKLITPGLARPFLNVIQDEERDELLFGSKLAEKIKASKAIEKQGLQIKKPVPAVKNTPASSSSTPVPRNQYQFQGNWAGPTRYQSNRGGRGAHRKATAARKPAPNPQAKPAGQAKTRAATQQ